jgi:hypothetical protein
LALPQRSAATTSVNSTISRNGTFTATGLVVNYELYEPRGCPSARPEREPARQMCGRERESVPRVSFS